MYATRYRLIDPVHFYLVYMNILTGISTRKPIQYITGAQALFVCHYHRDV